MDTVDGDMEQSAQLLGELLTAEVLQVDSVVQLLVLHADVDGEARRHFPREERVVGLLTGEAQQPTAS